MDLYHFFSDYLPLENLSNAMLL